MRSHVRRTECLLQTVPGVDPRQVSGRAREPFLRLLRRGHEGSGVGERRRRRL